MIVRLNCTGLIAQNWMTSPGMHPRAHLLLWQSQGTQFGMHRDVGPWSAYSAGYHVLASRSNAVTKIREDMQTIQYGQSNKTMTIPSQQRHRVQ
jgi:hypothetical protein